MIRLALVGCGPWAQDYACVASRLMGAVVAVAVDSDARRAAWAARLLNAAPLVVGSPECLASHAAEFDAIILHVPLADHSQYIHGAAAAGKHVLVAPPLTLSVSDACSLHQCSQQAGVRLMVASADRFLPSLTTLKSSLDKGQLGQLGLMRLHRWETVGPDQRDSATDASHGESAACLARDITLCHWLFGQMPTQVLAHGRGGPGAALPFHYLQLHLGFAAGGMAMLDYTRDLPRGSGYFSLSVIGSSGAAYADDQHNHQLMFTGGRATSVPTEQGLLGQLGRLQEFVRAIEQQRDPAGGSGEACQVMTIIEVAQQSIASGTVCQRREGDGVYVPT